MIRLSDNNDILIKRRRLIKTSTIVKVKRERKIKKVRIRMYEMKFVVEEIRKEEEDGMKEIMESTKEWREPIYDIGVTVKKNKI